MHLSRLYYERKYFHKYKVKIGDKANHTGWEKVSESFYRQNENYWGMALLSKTEYGYVTKTPSPPGYQYVGNSRYGECRTDSSRNSFWAFYGQYMVMSHMFGMFNRPVYQNDYNTYTNYSTNNRPYYRDNNQYGTNGTITKQTHKNFFARKMAKQRMAKRSFREKVGQKIGRSQSPFRSSPSLVHSLISFLCILNTMESAGFTVLPYHNNVPTLGE